ncbi:MAG: double-strand break repair helicase AddA, partial [Geminicoccaceae bacterium]|nr:double-strand break repair helicase AddA [Geminicoccaceae bacterium]
GLCAQLQEHRRLLYVALTRARERLIVAGWQRKGSAADASWHELIVAGMERLGAERVPARLGPELAGETLRYGNLAPPGPAQLRLPLRAPTPDRPAPPPPWLRRPAPAEAPTQAPLSPSRTLEEDATSAASPLLVASTGRYRRGRLIHRLLQSLPSRPPSERAAALARYLALPSLGVVETEQAALAAEVLAVLALPELAPLFGPGSRAEVALAGVVGGQVIFGQVDRLAVTEDAVLLIDYKTNRTPPETTAQVPPGYLRQMAAYQALLEAIYPGRSVRCALLWTEGPRLMALDDAALAPWIVRRVDVGQAPGADGADLDDGLLVDEDVVRLAGRKGEEAARGQGLGLALIGGLSHPEAERPRDHRDDLVDRMHVRRDAVALRQLEPQREQAFLGRIAEQDRRLGSGREHGGRGGPFDLLGCDDRVPIHRLG